MKLTDPERLILVMLCDIHKHLKIKSGIDAEFVREAIDSDNTWALYSRYRESVLKDEYETPAAVRLVMDILDMWQCIEISHDRLSTEDRERLAAEGLSCTFPGFDGNNEDESLSIALFLIEQLKKWRHFKDRDLNSHGFGNVEIYQRMLPVFARYRASDGRLRLTVSQLREILTSSRWPHSSAHRA